MRMDDFFPIRGFDHLELYVGNAKQASVFYATCFGFRKPAYRGLATGSRDIASYLMGQGSIRLVLTTALNPDHPAARGVLQHGDGVAVIALQVPDARRAYREAIARGAVGAAAPSEERDDSGVLRSAAIHIYGDTLLKFVEREGYRGAFAPGYKPRSAAPASPGVGLTAIDHLVGNVELGGMDRWVRFFAETMGFTQLVHFDDKSISTEYSALMSKVMQDGTGRIKFPINEPATGRRKSQIEEYLEYYRGPGVQHIACACDDIIEAVSRMRARGVQFLRVPRTYYEDLGERVGKIDESVGALAALGILADRDDEGYLLQIFT